MLQMLTTQPKKKCAANRKKTLQIKKTTFVILTMHSLHMLTTQPKKKRTAYRKKTLQIKKTTFVNNACVVSIWSMCVVKLMKLFS